MRIAGFLCLLGFLTIAGCPEAVPVDDVTSLMPSGNDPISPAPQDDQEANSGTSGGQNPKPPADSGQGSGSDDPDDDGSDPPEDPPPVDNVNKIPMGEYAGLITVNAQLGSRAAGTEAELEAPHIGNVIRIDADGVPYVADRWLSDGGGVAAEGLTTFRLVAGPEPTVHLVRMTIEKLEIDTDLVKVYWSVDTPYRCDPDTCVDTYEYDAASDSLTVTTNVQLKWDATSGGEETLTVTGQGIFVLR